MIVPSNFGAGRKASPPAAADAGGFAGGMLKGADEALGGVTLGAETLGAEALGAETLGGVTPEALMLGGANAGAETLGADADGAEAAGGEKPGGEALAAGMLKLPMVPM